MPSEKTVHWETKSKAVGCVEYRRRLCCFSVAEHFAQAIIPFRDYLENKAAPFLRPPYRATGPGHPNPVGFFERGRFFAERRPYSDVSVFNRPRRHWTFCELRKTQ